MRSERDILSDLKARLEGLEAERQRILTAIAVIEGTPMPGATVVSAHSATEPGGGIYAGMTITDAAIHFLQAEGRPAKTGEIARALAAGKIPSTSKNLYRMVYNSLSHRATTKRDIQRKGSAWVLK